MVSFFRQAKCRRSDACKIGNGPGASVANTMNRSVSSTYGPLSATPKSTGWSAGVLQRQPLSVFWNANAFSIRSLRATEKPSQIAGDGFAQHMPVQLDAIGL